MIRDRVRIGAGLGLALGVLAFASMVGARLVAAVNAAGGGSVNLPYVMRDAGGNSWRVYNGGWFQKASSPPVYGQGAMLTVNGQNLNQNVNQGTLDPKTGELVLENMPANGCTVTRRICLDPNSGGIRYLDVIHNTQNQPQTFQVMIQSTCNFGINAGQGVADPRKKDQNLGWVGQTGANQSIVEIYAGRGSKLAPQINWPQGNNVVQATLSLSVPAGKDAAILHLHTVAPTQEAGEKLITGLNETALLKTLPSALRRLIANFRSGQDFVGDLEILRGGLLDVVELRGGDQFKGTLRQKQYDLQTFYGNVSFPAEKVVGLINVGQFRPRQLLVTADGQIFGGYLQQQSIDLQLSSGQVTQIPINQVSRAGYRKRDGEPAEWTFDKPMVLLRSGDRVDVRMPQHPIEIVTRYGKLALKPEQLAAVQLQNDDNSVHEIELTDGSRFAGLMTADAFDATLDTGAADQAVKFPTGSIARIQLTPKVRDGDDATPSIRLSNDDEVVGALTGKLQLDTAFDRIAINAAEMRQLHHDPDGGPADVQVTLWDGTTFSGQLEDQELACQSLAGVVMNVPASLVRDYVQPQPKPSAAVIDRIKHVVESELNNEDYHVRDHARTELLNMGDPVASVLKGLRDEQPPEARKSIDWILGELARQTATKKPAAAAPVPDDEN